MSNNHRQIASVVNAVAALRALAVHPEGLGVTQLAGLIGIGKSSVHLLLSTLADLDFATKGPDSRYRLGLGAFEVGAAAGGVAAAGGPLTAELRDLAQRSGEAVSLAAAHGSSALILQRIESANVLRAEIQVGTRMPLHSSASGKLLLSAMEDDRLEALFPDERLPWVTEHTVKSKSELRAQLSEIRDRAVALNDDEYTVGVSAAATGIYDGTSTVAFALSIAGPTQRFRRDDWIPDLKETARRMTKSLQDLAPVIGVASAQRYPQGVLR